MFNLNQDRFPFQTQNKTIKIGILYVFTLSNGTSIPSFEVYLTPPDATPDWANDRINPADTFFGGVLHKEKTYSTGQEPGIGDWLLKVKSTDFYAFANLIDDIVLVCEYLAT